jgi:hypothetical protein
MVVMVLPGFQVRRFFFFLCMPCSETHSETRTRPAERGCSLQSRKLMQAYVTFMKRCGTKDRDESEALLFFPYKERNRTIGSRSRRYLTEAVSHKADHILTNTSRTLFLSRMTALRRFCDVAAKKLPEGTFSPGNVSVNEKGLYNC